MELAQLWCADGRPTIPHAVTDALERNQLTAGFTGWDVDAEYVTALDGFRGEGRNHDLVIVGEAQGVPTLVAVEAKAAESFGDPVTKTINSALKRSAKSKVPARIAALSRAVLGEPGVTWESGPTGPSSISASNVVVDPRIEDLGYQLFTAAVGTVIEADRRHCRCAVMLVHRFVEPHPTPAQQQAYQHGLADLNAFQALLTPLPRALSAPSCSGPFSLHPSATIPKGIDLFLAMCETLLPPP